MRRPENDREFELVTDDLDTARMMIEKCDGLEDARPIEVALALGLARVAVETHEVARNSRPSYRRRRGSGRRQT